jgi:hypothetical protein
MFPFNGKFQHDPAGSLAFRDGGVGRQAKSGRTQLKAT